MSEDSPTTMDYLVAKAWLKKTGQWGLQTEMLDGPSICVHADRLYYESSPEHQELWKRIEVAFRAAS